MDRRRIFRKWGESCETLCDVQVKFFKVYFSPSPTYAHANAPIFLDDVVAWLNLSFLSLSLLLILRFILIFLNNREQRRAELLRALPPLHKIKIDTKQMSSGGKIEMEIGVSYVFLCLKKKRKKKKNNIFMFICLHNTRTHIHKWKKRIMLSMKRKTRHINLRVFVRNPFLL